MQYYYILFGIFVHLDKKGEFKMSELGITKKIGFMEVFNPIESN